MTLSTVRSFKFEDVKAMFMDDDDSGQDFTADLVERQIDVGIIQMRQEDALKWWWFITRRSRRGINTIRIRNYWSCKDRRTREKSSGI